jgi:hypothetical protein
LGKVWGGEEKWEGWRFKVAEAETHPGARRMQEDDLEAMVLVSNLKTSK